MNITRLTFRDWLLRQTAINDRIGDLARDADDDVCWRGTTALSLRRHILSHHGGTDESIETTRIAERLHATEAQP